MSGFIDAFSQSASIAVIIAALINHALVWRSGRLKYYYSSIVTASKIKNLFRPIDKSPELVEFYSMILRFSYMTVVLTVILMIVKVV